MPTKREREYYSMGFRDGIRTGEAESLWGGRYPEKITLPSGSKIRTERVPEFKQRKRKLSAWNKYVKANSKKPRFRYRNGKLNLKKMAVAFRKTPAGKKKR